MTGRTRRRTAALIVLVGAAVGPVAPAASAHPFGPPATLELTVDGRGAELRWQAAPDDLIALGGALGVLPSRREIVIDPGATEDDLAPVEEDDATRLRTSDALAGHLAATIRVLQDDTPCPSEVDLSRLVDAGAAVTVTCPEPIRDVDVEVSTLTGLHEAYRTVVVGPAHSEPGRSLHTASEPRIGWRFTAGEDATGTAGMASDGAGTGPLGRIDGGGATALLLLAGVVAAIGLGRVRSGRRDGPTRGPRAPGSWKGRYVRPRWSPPRS